MNNLYSEVLGLSVVAVFDDDDDLILMISFVSSLLILVVALPMYLFDFPLVDECANSLSRREESRRINCLLACVPARP
jgi:hypothetical protein